MARIAVAGATGRVGRHVVDVLRENGHEAVAISRSAGVDVITGDGLAAALDGVEVVIDVTTGPSPEQGAATEFFTTATRNLEEAGGKPACGGWWWCPSSAPTGPPPATARPSSRTSGPRWPARSRRGSCARPSSTSSWRC